MGGPSKVVRVVEPTELQKKGVENIMSGDFQSRPKALEGAGYSKKSSKKGSDWVKQAGVHKYVELLDKESIRKYGKENGIRAKVVEVYVAGLEATKLFGKNAIEHPDWLARKAFADRVAPMLGMGTGAPEPGKGNQYNFFMFDNREKSEFNSAFGKFVKGHFKQSKT